MQAGSKLRIEGLSKTYRGAGGGENVTALKDVGIEIGAGEFVSIVGPSGCGKPNGRNSTWRRPCGASRPPR